MFSYLLKYHSQVSFNLKVILSMLKTLKYRDVAPLTRDVQGRRGRVGRGGGGGGCGLCF